MKKFLPIFLALALCVNFLACDPVIASAATLNSEVSLSEVLSYDSEAGTVELRLFNSTKEGTHTFNLKEDHNALLKDWDDVNFTLVSFARDGNNTYADVYYRIIAYASDTELRVHDIYDSTMKSSYLHGNVFERGTTEFAPYLYFTLIDYNGDGAISSPSSIVLKTVSSNNCIVDYMSNQECSYEYFKDELSSTSFTTSTVYRCNAETYEITEVFMKALPQTETVVAKTLMETKTSLAGVLDQTVKILPILLVLLVGFVGLRKALALLQAVLHQA